MTDPDMVQEVRCQDCSWEGAINELVCSDEDFKSDKPSRECNFNRCPRCNSLNIEDLE